MRYLVYLLLLLSTAALWEGCKKDDPCVEDFVGDWECNVNGTLPTGGCGSSTILNISGDSDCKVIISNLLGSCSSSDFQVKAVVSGDSILIGSQPFGANTITGKGTVYLNQISINTNLSNGATYLIVGSR